MTIGIALRSAVILACALGAMTLMRRRSAAARHAVLAAGIACSLLVPLMRFAPHWRVAVSRTQSPRAAVAAPRALLIDALREKPVSSQPSPASDAVVIVWWIGCLGLAVRVGISQVAAHRLLARSTRRGDVYVSDDIDAPVTIGLLRPAIVVPRGFDSWPISDRDAALAHEAAHVARRDPLVQLAADLARCVYWFNPLVWIAFRRLRLECERACDERVLAAGHAAGDYATLLLNLARTATRSAALAISSPTELERRIVDVLADTPRKSPGPFAHAALAAAVLAVAIPVAAIVPADAFDRYLDPLSERVPGVRDAIPNVTAAADEAAIIERHRAGAAKTPTWRGDLVADRSRWALAQVRNGRIVEPLIGALADDDWRVRGYAAWALGEAGDQQATPALIPLLDDPVWRMRGAAAAALHHLADPRAEKAMETALHDDAWQVRVEAASYFAERDDHQRLAPMLSDRHIAVRSVAEEALQR
ncbi:MAG: bla regulator protein blaR1 [Thermoanaerobaculia bacterium]|nr:bla regulator protein blaR1 [Thermoanaerobaculia bacterium]